ncbi:unnamed protein product, partial [Clonostachys byssicola]
EQGTGIMITVTKTKAGKKAQASTTLVAEPQFPDINTIRNAIPKHCFESSAVIGLAYLVRDLCMAVGLGYAAVTYIPTISDFYLRSFAWIVYGYVQGLICTGIWILGHECGHGAFSKYQTFNDVVGWFAHSILCVPYFSWKFSHHRHHRFTGHMDKDMAFAPRTKADYLERILSKFEFLEDTPIYHIICLFFHQTMGWTFYLIFNISAGRNSMQYKASLGRRSHFDPWSGVFRPSEAPFIILSDIGLGLTLYSLYRLSFFVGVQNTALLYAQTWFWVHHWLIAITYLHHTDKDVPHYDAEHWTFVKGAVATIDREFGFVGRHLFHGIIEYHVVHHLFPRIPFYYAEEATEAIKPVLGDLYRRDERSFLGQLWDNFSNLKYVEPDVAIPGAMKWVTRA